MIKVPVIFRCVQTKAGNKFIHPPVLPLGVLVAVSAVDGRHISQGAHRTSAPTVEIIGDSAGIGHHLIRLFKGVFVDLLQHIGIPGVGVDLVGGIDVTAAEFRAGEGLSPKLESLGGF